MSMTRKILRDDQWMKLAALLPGKKGNRGRTGQDNRLFLEAVLWIVRTGSPWRDLPLELGDWHTTYTRFKRWAKQAFGENWLMRLAATWTWRHWWLTAQQCESISMPQAQKKRRCAGIALIKGFDAQAVLADKGYDSNEIVSYIRDHQMHAVIPPKNNRIEQRQYDKHLYKERNLVERFFSRIKRFRRIATRYEKLDSNFLSFVNLLFAIRTYAKLSQLGVPTKTVLEHGEAATTTLGRFCVSPSYYLLGLNVNRS